MTAHQELPEWALWIQWAATIGIAIGAFYIGYRQWRTAHDRIALDLFEKRYEIFRAMVSTVAHILIQGRVTDALDREFYELYLKAKFIFDTDVTEFLDATKKCISEYKRNEEITRRQNTSEVIKAASERQDRCGALLTEFTEQAEAKMRRYLQFKHATRTL